MIKKIKEKISQLKNEKGFTLVELLAVIVILGIILAIAVPAIGNILSKAEDKATAAEKELVLDAARLANVNGEFQSDGSMTVTELQTIGYLEGDDLPSGTVTYDSTDQTFSFGGTTAPAEDAETGN